MIEQNIKNKYIMNTLNNISLMLDNDNKKMYSTSNPWRRKWQFNPLLPGESHGQRSLVGFSP